MTERKVIYSSLDTPAVLVDMNKLEANIREMSRLATEAGVRLRPHIKFHESTLIAKMQIEAGACGIDVGPVAQAEAMAEEGINNIIIAHPGFYGDHKLKTLIRLLSNPRLKITIVVDMIEQAEGISRAGQAVGREVPVLLKLEVNQDIGGLQRYGVLPGEPTLNLAKRLCQLPGIKFTGIYAHEMHAEQSAKGIDNITFKTAEILTKTAKMLKREGITVEHVSMGASATLRATCRYLKEGKFPEITEIHPGSFVIGDIMYMRLRGNTMRTCALSVLTTVMSTSHPDFAIIDAGYKTFGNDSLIGAREQPDFFWKEMPSFGSIQGRPDLWLGFLHAETSLVYYTDPKKKRLRLGERLEIVPNNATLVINIHNQLYGVRNSMVERVIPVTGRGQGN